MIYSAYSNNVLDQTLWSIRYLLYAKYINFKKKKFENFINFFLLNYSIKFKTYSEDSGLSPNTRNFVLVSKLIIGVFLSNKNAKPLMF